MSRIFTNEFKKIFMDVFLLQQMTGVILIGLSSKGVDVDEEPMSNIFTSIYQTFIFFMYIVCYYADQDRKFKNKKSLVQFVKEEIQPQSEDFFDYKISLEELKIFFIKVQNFSKNFLKEAVEFE